MTLPDTDKGRPEPRGMTPAEARAFADGFQPSPYLRERAARAADTIDRLTAENARLRAERDAHVFALAASESRAAALSAVVGEARNALWAVTRVAERNEVGVETAKANALIARLARIAALTGTGETAETKGGE